MSDLDKAIATIRAGKRAKGRKLLMAHLRTHPDDANAWLWLASVIEDRNRRTQAIARVLELEPGNEAARKQLALLGRRSAVPEPEWEIEEEKGSVWSRIPVLVILVLVIFACIGAGVLTSESSAGSNRSEAEEADGENVLTVPAGQLSRYVDEYSNYDEVYIHKKDGSLDDRPNDLEELCLDYVFYRSKIMEYAAAGEMEKADDARRTFQQVNNWLNEYDNGDFEIMYFEILDLGN